MIGFVYILTSPNTQFIKIGGTAQSLAERLRGINGTESYAEHGPWEVSDFLQVTDWRLVESSLHAAFSEARITDIIGTRELFRIPPVTARDRLREVAPELRIGHAKTDTLFKSRNLHLYLHRLFEIAGLYGNLDIQGAWTLSLFPSTAGGRYFTLNIGSHEVAYSPREQRGSSCGRHVIVMDQLAGEFVVVRDWLKRYGGEIREAPYKTARNRAVALEFECDFARAETLFLVPGIRRAMVAYWADALSDLRERKALSVYERYHNYDAVHALLNYKEARHAPISDCPKPA